MATTQTEPMFSMARDQKPILKLVQCIVHFLDNSEATFEVEKKDKAQILINLVFDHLELAEQKYFGLQFSDTLLSSDEKNADNSTELIRWLDPAKSFKKQMKSSPPYRFYFRVKFYVPDPGCLNEEYTRYHFFLQLTKDLVDGRLRAPLKTAILLASYAVQSELGDYNPDEHGPHYLSEFRFIPNQTDEMLREVEALHKKHRGMSPAMCEMAYIDISKKLDGYGIDLFKATLDQTNEGIQLGVTSVGLVVFKENIRVNMFSWAKIVKISFKRKLFYIHLHKETDENVENLFGFNMTSYRSCKNLWKSCVEHHTFFCLHTQQQNQEFNSAMVSQFRNSSGSQPVDRVAAQLEAAFTRSQSDKLSKSRPLEWRIPESSSAAVDGSPSNIHFHTCLNRCDANRIAGIESRLSPTSPSNLNYVSSPTHQPSMCANPAYSNYYSGATCGGAGPLNSFAGQSNPSIYHYNMPTAVSNLPISPRLNKDTLGLEQRTNKLSDCNTRTVLIRADNKGHRRSFESKLNCHIEVSSDEEDKAGNDNRLHPLETLSPVVVQSNSIKVTESLGQSLSLDQQTYRETQQSNDGSSAAANNRQFDGLITIRMKPDEQGRFGFNVKGGADQMQPIIVSRVAPGSPADLCIPRLTEGDHVLFINGRDVSQHTHAQVVQFIRASREIHSGELVLVVRQNVYLNDGGYGEPDFQYIPDTHHIIAVLPPGGDPLSASITLLRESLESNAGVAQFEQLYRKKAGLTMLISQQTDNLCKNRYRDISPYDQTRVKLKEAANDYINANFVNMEIPGSGIINRYIAAQGPLPETSADFWSMVWEQRSSLVVMLTMVSERGRVKCHQYWPDLHKTVQYDDMVVTCFSEEVTPSFAFRDLTLIKNESNCEERHVYQMQYMAWPDHGVPDDSTDFLDFVSLVRQNRCGVVEPTVVHCSAGIGRTGVLIAMETAMCMIEANQPIHMLDIVRQMRDQRAMLIQTSSQYKFVCEAVVKVYDDRLVVPQDEFTR